MDSKDAINQLPGDLKLVAEEIGLEATMKLVKKFGGGYLVIPKCVALINNIRDNEIRRLYNAGGCTRRDLAWKSRLTIRQIDNILSETNSEVHPTLFDLAEGN